MDEAAVRRVFVELSLAAGAFYHASVPAFETRLRRFNQAARHSPWFALCDLDFDKPHDPRMRQAAQEDKLSEILMRGETPCRTMLRQAALNAV